MQSNDVTTGRFITILIIVVAVLVGMRIFGGKEIEPPLPPPPVPVQMQLQADIIKSLQTAGVIVMAKEDLDVQRTNVLLNSRMMCRGYTSRDPEHQFLVPVREFYGIYDKRAVVYWVTGKRRVLVRKTAIKQEIVLIGGKGHVWPSTIADMEEIRLRTNYEFGIVDFIK